MLGSKVNMPSGRFTGDAGVCTPPPKLEQNFVKCWILVTMLLHGEV